MAHKPTNTRIEVAIVGGGVSGLCLAIALLKYPHIKVDIYEAAPAFAEIGAGVAFGPNACNALRMISPEVEQAFLRQVTHNGWEELRHTWNEFRWAGGPNAGEIIASPTTEIGQATAHRAKLLAELMNLLPKEIVHFSKRLVRIEEKSVTDKIQLHFEGDVVAEAHAIVGAEGVHGIIRAYLLGENHPATPPLYSGAVGYRAILPMQDVVAAVGDRLARNSIIWVGKCAAIIHYPIDSGEMVNIVATNYFTKDWEGPWVKPVHFSAIEEEYRAFTGSAKAVIELLDNTQTAKWSLWEHAPAPTYARGAIAIIGDAAHAMTPWQGQGAGQAIEDSLLLGRLFAAVDMPSKVGPALQAYDYIRRPRTQKVCETSREAGYLFTSQTLVSEDPMKFKETIESRMDWIWNHDLDRETREALDHMERILADGEHQSQ